MSSLLADVDSAPITRTPTPPRRWPALASWSAWGFCYTWHNMPGVAAPEVLPAMPMFMASFWGPMVCTVLIGLGWLILGRAPWRTRVASVVLVALLVAAAVFAAHPSARFFLVMKGVPAATGLVVLFWCFSSFLPALNPAALALGVGILALSPWELVQFNGVTGQFGMDPSGAGGPMPRKSPLHLTRTKILSRPARKCRWLPAPPTGLLSADHGKMARSPTSTSAIGRRHRSNCGGGRSDRSGHLAASSATDFSPRSSGASRNWSCATTHRPAPSCGRPATRRAIPTCRAGLGRAAPRPSTRAKSTPSARPAS